MSTFRGQRVVAQIDIGGVPWDGSVQKPLLDILSEPSSENPEVTFYGLAKPGTATSTNEWQIFALEKGSGLKKRYAEGSADFSFIWDNREIYSYVDIPTT